MKILRTLKVVVQPGSRLSQRVLHAGFWMVAMRVAVRSLGIVRIIVLARLLTPTDFGLVGIALLVMGFLESFTEIGFDYALVQRKGNISSHLNTVWTVFFVQQLLLGGILIASGHWIAVFFSAPAAGPIVQVMGGIAAISGFKNIGLVYFRKELEFNKRFIFETVVVVADLAVAIPAALLLRNAWALVFGSLASNVIGVILSYFIHPYRPRPSFSIQRARELFSFGKWVFLTTTVVSLSQRADSLVIGKFIGASALGLYQIANRVSDEPLQEIKTTTASVAFPAYSKIQDNPPLLSQGFLSMVEFVAVIVFPFAIVILLLAPDFTRLVLGEQWMPAVAAMQVLGLAAAIKIIVATGGSLYMGMGHPRLNFYITLLRAVAILASIYPLTKIFGVTGAALSMLIAAVVTLPLFIWYPWTLLKIKVTQIGKALLPSAVISLGLGAGILVTKHVFSQVALGEFIIILCVVIVIYLSFAFLLWKLFKSGPVQILTSLIDSN